MLLLLLKVAMAAVKMSLTLNVKKLVKLKSTVIMLERKESIAVNQAPENTARHGRQVLIGLSMMGTVKVLSLNFAKKIGSLPTQKTGGVWVTKPFTNRKKGVEKIKAHEKSSSHCLARESALAAEGILRTGSVFQQLLRANKEERLKNRAAVKSLIRCTHFLVRNHMAHTTNFEKLVDLVVSCGGDTLAYFMANAAKKCCVHISHSCC